MTPHGFPPSLAGYFNWAAFRTTALNLSAERLSNCSKIGIDVYALELAKHLCNHYPILESRKQSLVTSVESSIHPDVDIDRKLDLRDDVYCLLKVINELASSGSGLAFLCICNVLGNHYTSQSMEKIFEELVKEAGVPEDLVPTEEAWQSLYPLFNSFQGPPMFTALVEKYTALGNEEPWASARPEIRHMGALSIVSAFMAMWHLARGKQPWIIALAGMDAGWKAAVAEWLFGLKIELRGSFQEERLCGERLIYTNCLSGEKTQMVIRFNPPGVPVDGEAIVDMPLEVRNESTK